MYPAECPPPLACCAKVTIHLSARIVCCQLESLVTAESSRQTADSPTNSHLQSDVDETPKCQYVERLVFQHLVHLFPAIGVRVDHRGRRRLTFDDGLRQKFVLTFPLEDQGDE
jgi:hypothetical protein